MLGLDYTARIDPAALKQAKVDVVFRYVMPQTPFWTKALTNAEAAELLAAGIGIVSNFESTADRMKGGTQAGHEDALTLLADWHALGAPAGLVGWFSADWDVQPQEVVLVLDYLTAAAEVLGGKQYVGLYGGYRAVSAAADNGFAIWQTSAWSYGRWDPRCAARQDGGQAVIGGVTVDLNTILNLNALGAWTGDTVSTIPPSIAAHFAGLDLSADFPPNATFDPSVALIWTDARAEAAYRQSALNTELLKQLVARPQIDQAALAALIDQHQTAGASADAIAAAVIAHLNVTVSAK